MRELVYLSDGKLRQFLPERRRRVPRAKWQLSTPVGGMGWEPELLDAVHARNERLHQVVQHVSASARWFAEPDLQPGSWVWFEAPLNYQALRGPWAVGMVLFTDTPGPVEGYETGGSVRLVLHGSARHLVGDREPFVAESLSAEEIPASIGGQGASHGMSWGRLAMHVPALLSALRGEPGATSEVPPSEISGTTLSDGTHDLLRNLDAQVAPETAAWMCGYARITAVTTWVNPDKRDDPTIRYVVGTPLYVEFLAAERTH
ncbi:SAVMC3_10250 family protein [Actinacidiphila glaucinigra]|uniref:SAVMC3_10250 family protein n=1 Tax=Actinacidiphila glaucinigra TaxID=235986 RepID=UPI00366E8331